MKLLALLLSATTLTALAVRANSQTIYTITGPTATVTEQTGPGAGPCAYPNGPFLGAFPTPVPFFCATSGPFGPPPAPLGDVAVDRVANLVYATDGVTITAYTPAGVVVNSFPSLAGFGLVTGMGMNGVAGILWITNGAMAAGLLPPAAPGCGPPFAIVPPFPLPAVGAPYTDIDWDPASASLFLCGVPGFIANVFPGGAVGPFGVYPAPLLCLAPPLFGLALDHAAAPFTGTMYVTNGVVIERIGLPGIVVPPTFYSPIPCFPAVAPPISGLAFSAHSISYGMPVPAAGPLLVGVGQSVSPNPAFAVAMTGATPGAFGLVYLAATSACPAIPFGANLIYLGLVPFPTFLGSGPIPATGTLTLALPVPPAMPIPASVFLQGFTIFGAALSNTPGMEISMTRP